MTVLSVEELATTSDDTAVHRRFDARNIVWLTFLLLGFAGVSIIELLANLVRRTPADVWIAAPNLVLVMLMLFLIRDVFRVARQATTKGMWAASQWIRRHVSATTITYVLAQLALCIAFARHGNAWAAWGIVFPFLVIGFRMLVSEAVLVHSAFFATSAAMSFVHPLKDRAGLIVATGVINAACLTVALILSRRMRREIVADWSERRRHAQEQLRMRAELQSARAIQLSMLPEAPPPIDWVDLAGVSLPATEVGGDYFDYFVIGERLAIVSGDVAGHGLASGLVLAALRAGFTLLRDSLDDPAAVLARLHELICDTTRQRTIVTAAVLLLDRDARLATFASAGHPPVVARLGGGVCAIELFAPPLGVRLPFRIAQKSIPFAVGDVFVLHTDGVYESMNAAGESYGIERIEVVVRNCGDGGAESIRDAIVRDVERFRDGRAQADDVTVVVARVT